MKEKQGTLILKVLANIQVKNEALLLEQILLEWDDYPIDHFVFYDDQSTDHTRDVIRDGLDVERYTILSYDREFHEARNRSAMLEYSRDLAADVVISIDADELLTDSLLEDFDEVMKMASRNKLLTYQWNLAGDMNHFRTDPAYRSNYRDFIFPMKHTGKFDLSLGQYHTPRTPPINLAPHTMSERYGFVHLQSVNVRFYALKQLWYKTFEYVEYGKSVDEINAAYDPVVNGLDLCPADLPSGVLYWPDFDASVFDAIAEERGYVDYILKNSVPELITFGEEYLR
jgi:hypothetical protein